MSFQTKKNTTPKVLHMVPRQFGVDGGVYGGAERYTFELARHMADQVETRLLTYGPREERFGIGNLKIHVAKSLYNVQAQITNPFSPFVLKDILWADVIHCHQQRIVSTSFVTLLASLFGKSVFVSNLGGDGWDISYHFPIHKLFRGHLHISNYSKKLLEKQFPGVHRIIMGGVDSTKFSPGTTSTSNKAALFVGRLLPHKGINYLVEAVPTSVPLKIIGKPYHKEFNVLLRKLSQGKNVAFESGCDDKELVQEYRNALVTVLPSVYRDVYGAEGLIPELLGQTLLESMACATPVICTNVASMPEIVEHNSTGFIVEPNSPDSIKEKLLTLANDSTLRKKMGLAARSWILSKFTWPKIVLHCLAYYSGFDSPKASQNNESPTHIEKKAV